MIHLAHSKLSWPSQRKPGINSNHIAAKQGQLRFSGVAMPGTGKNFLGLFPFVKKGTTAGTVITQFYNQIGPAVGYAAAGGAARISFSGVSAVQDATQTFGLIFVDTAVATEQHLLCSGNSSNYLGIGILSSNPQMRNGEFGSDFAATNITLVNNTPYFMCGSVSSGAMNFAVLNLNTGQLFTQSTSGVAPAGAPSGTCTVGGDGGSFGLGGFIAAAMYSSTFLTIPQLKQWAGDPWSFWYPQDPLDTILTSLSTPPSGGAPPGLQQYDLPGGQILWDRTQLAKSADQGSTTWLNSGTKPFKQDDWPIPSTSVPFRPQFSVDQKAQAPFAKPFKEDNWPLPIQPWNKGDLNKSYDLAPTPSRLLAGAQPFSQTDWPLSQKFAAEPAQTHYVRQWTWNFNPGQMTTGNKPLFQVEWPNPTPQFRPQFSFDVSTPSVRQAQPFNQYDWPLSGRAAPLNVSSDQGNATFLTVTVTAPRNQYDWPLPVASYRLLYGGFYNKAQNLGKTPFSQTDWPLPTPSFRPQFSFDPSAPTWLTPVVTSPRNQYDWPLPTQPFRPQFSWDVYFRLAQPFGAQFFELPPQPFRPQFSSDLRAQAPFAKPFLQTEWPLVPGPFQFNRTIDQGSTTWLNSGQAPFHQTEWPLPTQPFRPDFAFMPPAPLWLAPVFAPRNQYDWPLPTLSWRLDQNYAQWFNPTQMQTGQKPFAQTEWPNPVPFFRPDFTYMPSAPLWLISTVVMPRNLYDWPLPIAASPLRYGVNYEVSYAPSPYPFNQFDWPLPIPPFRPLFSADQALATRLSGGQKPFLQTDWPVPSFWVPFRPQISYEQSVARFLSSGTKPFVQTDWPLPIPNPYGNVTIYTIVGANNPNIYAKAPTTVKIEWLIRARRRGRR